MPEVYVGGKDRKPLLINGGYARLHHFSHAYVDQKVSR